MPQAVAAVWSWAGSVLSGTAYGAGTLASALAQSVAWSAISFGVQSAFKQGGSRSQGNLIDLELNSSAPRRMLVGKRMVGGVLADWYLSGDANKKIYLPIYLGEGPCGQVTKVFAGGREIHSTPLVHGVRTAMGEYRDVRDRLWVTYYDGRAGQTADPVLVALYQGWTNTHTMEGCAYVVVECHWSDAVLRTPPSLSFEMEGAKLYDRRKDSTAGGSGAHRLTDPATWEFSDNPAVALDHFMLGRYWDGVRVMGVGLDPDDVPYARFAAQANLCDEDVALKAGGTQKRYRSNGLIFADDEYDTTIKRLCTAMASRPADFGGRFGTIGIEAKTPVLTIDQADLIEGMGDTYTPKRTWAALVGAIEGRYQPENRLYQPTDFPRVSDAAWAAEDGGEPKVKTLDLEFETDGERAQRLALLDARYERRQATLTGVYPLWTMESERGDWILRTGGRFGESGKTFEVMQRVIDVETMTVSMIMQEVDPADEAWDESTAQDPPPALTPSTATLGAIDPPVLTAADHLMTGAGSRVPALKVSWVTPDDERIRNILVEVRRTSDDLKVATVTAPIPDDDDELIIQNGISEGVAYTVRARYLSGALFSEWSTGVGQTTGTTYEAGAADSVPWSGVTDSGGKPDDNADVTGSNISAGFVDQGVLATQDTVTRDLLSSGDVTNLVENGNFAQGSTGWPAGAGSVVDSTTGSYVGSKRFLVEGDGTGQTINTAVFGVTPGETLILMAAGKKVATGTAGYVEVRARFVDASGAYLTQSSVAWNSGDSIAYVVKRKAALVPAGAVRASVAIYRASFAGGAQYSIGAVSCRPAARVGGDIVLADGATVPTDAQLVTSQGTAAAVTGQGLGATSNDLGDLDAAADAKLSGIEAGADVTSGNISAGFSGQGVLATQDTVTRDLLSSGDVTNLVENAVFALGSEGWATGAGVVQTSSSGSYVGDKRFFASGDGSGQSINSAVFDVIPGESISLMAAVKKVATGTAGTLEVRIRYVDASDSYLSVQILSWPSTSLASYTVKRQTWVIPAGAAKASVAIYRNGFAGGAQYAVGAVSCRRPARVGDNIVLNDGSTVPTDAQLVTAQGIAAAVTGQANGATTNFYVQASEPASPVNGMWWGDTTAQKLKVRVSGAWVIVADITPAGTVAFTATIGGTKSKTQGTAATVTFTNIVVTTANASGAVSYEWTHLSGDDFNITGATSAAPDFSIFVNGADKYGTYEVKVIDEGTGEVLTRRLSLVVVWTG